MSDVSVSFPLLMGQTSTPDCLLDGRAYRLGKKTRPNTPQWEAVERRVHAGKEQLRGKFAAKLPEADPEHTAQAPDQWSRRQAEMLDGSAVHTESR